MNYCETCKYYRHTPNILGGIAECVLGEKSLMTFWKNKACEKYQHTDVDNMDAQNKYYKEHLQGLLQMESG